MRVRAAIALFGFVAVSAHAATFTVINNSDSGAGSLRDAINQANAAPGADTILFDPGVTGTIVLTSGQLFSSGPLTITGPSAAVLAIDGGATDRILAVTDNPELACPNTTGPTDFLVSISGLTFRNGNRTATNSGGAIGSTKSLTLQDIVFENNHARFGGAVAMLTQYPNQTLTIQNVQFLNNSARTSGSVSVLGGALRVAPYCPGAFTTTTINIANSLFQGNQAVGVDLQQAYAGAIELEVEGDVTITGSRIVGNSVVLPANLGAFSYAAGGIGAYVKNLTIQDTEISDNAGNSGGGIEVYNNLANRQGAADMTTFKLINSTVSRNTAYQTGGGVNIFANVAAQISNSTVAANVGSANRTGGVRVANGAGLTAPSLVMVSSILADSNATTVDLGIGTTAMPLPFPVSTTNSLIEVVDSNANVTGTGNITGVDPILGPLAFNGGTTRTHAVFGGSPAINTGSNPAALTTDQRGAGFPRVIGAAADMGAFETSATTFTVTNNNDSGAGSLRSMVAAAIAAGQSNTVDFAPNVTGTIVLTSGSIQVPGAVNVAGPGAGVLTVDGNANNRIFTIFESSSPPCPALTGPNLYLVTVSGLTLTNAFRKTDNSGGAIVTGHSLVLKDVVVQNSQAKNGGGVGFFAQFPGQSLTITNSQFLNNIAKPLSVITTGNTGGGLRVGENCTGARTTPVTVTIANSLFSGNSAQPVALNGQGGGIDASGSYADITITDSRIVNNSVIVPNPPVANQNYRGAGIFASAKSLTIRRSEISGNTNADVSASGVTRAGGLGVQNNLSDLQGAADVFPVTIVNSTISGNSDAGLGGGIWANGNVALNIENSTIAANTAPAGNTGGIRLTTGQTNPVTASNATAPTLTLVSSIVATNTADDVATNLATIPAFTLNATNSLFGTVCPSPTCEITLSGAGNLLGVNPQLGPLANNGGTTQTHALLAGSPAINAGSNPLSLTTDQRGTGFPRVIGGTADMGAYEFNAAVAPTLVSAVSRRAHGAAGAFNLPLTLVAPPAINHNPTTEPRQGPAQTIVFTFDKAITGATATVTEGTATAAAPTFSGNDVVVALTSVIDRQYVTVSLTNVASADGGTGGVGSARVGFLVGDVNQSRVVSVADLGLVNTQLAQSTSAANYLKDVNASGSITIADKGVTNANLTKALVAP